MNESVDKNEPLISHLKDLQVSLIRAIIGFFGAVIIAYGFSDYILEILRTPMLKAMPANFQFVVLAPHEYFFTKLKASFFVGLIISSPWIFLQIWLFLAPGLYRNEKKWLLLFVVSASLCFILGILFAYFLVFPPTFKFFIDTLPSNIAGAYSISMLMGFAMTVIIAFGIIFQTPIAVMLLLILGILEVETLTKYRSFVIVAFFILGALLTPPDPITQVMLAVPAYLLFELGILGAKIFLKGQKNSVKESPAE